VIVVTGHERDRVEEALAGRPVIFAHAEDFAQGLSASLKSGLAALPAQSDGVMI
jgi:molybdenum cofactor cytidylyltransferase